MLALIFAFGQPAVAGANESFRITKDWTLIFKRDGTLALWRRGWFSNEEHPIVTTNDEWFVSFGPADFRRIDIGSQPTPTTHYSPHLEPHGRVSCWWQDDGVIRIFPAKVIDGEWKFYADGEWLPVFFDE